MWLFHINNCKIPGRWAKLGLKIILWGKILWGKIKDIAVIVKQKINFVIGGCRSGKSDYALKLADAVSSQNKYFIATSVPTDGEMEKRVQKHQKERGADWRTLEEPVDIDKAIDQYSRKAGVILVDCLTLWVSNMMFRQWDQDQIETMTSKLEDSLKRSACPVFLVSNEVGLGVVPENMLARRFRDLAGFVNQRMAETADRVIMTVAGIPVTIKPAPVGSEPNPGSDLS